LTQSTYGFERLWKTEVMRDIQSGNRVVESLFDICEVDAELLVDPVVAQGVAGGQERVDLYSLMIGGTRIVLCAGRLRVATP